VDLANKKRPPPRRRWSCAFIQTAGKSLSVMTTARPETSSGATPHRSADSLQRKCSRVNYVFESFLRARACICYASLKLLFTGLLQIHPALT
jgi:hypothetical protein